uniref:head maturation protease, ClpP-related n=1 Tax=Succinivibrio sp. TaxID=2053619 RepID=UPI00402A85AA
MLIQIQTNDDGSQATLDLIGTFDNDGFFTASSDKSFVSEYRKISPNADITINLNSPGGSVNSAMTIRNLLAQHKGKITCNVLGWAASAATFITSLANVHVRMMQGSFLMIHNPLNVAMGNQHALRKQADNLELIANSMARIYADKSGMDINEIKRLMDAETWFSAEDAVKCHLADELIPTSKVVAQADTDGTPVLGGVALSGGLKHPQNLVIKEEKTDMADIKNATNPNVANKLTDAQASVKSSVSSAVAITSIEQLKSHYPELTNTLVNDAVNAALTAERSRLKSLDAIRDKNPQIVDNAKYVTFADAAQTALAILQQSDLTQHNKAEAVKKDAENVADTLSKLSASSNPDAGTSSENMTGTVAASQAWISLMEKTKEL